MSRERRPVAVLGAAVAVLLAGAGPAASDGSTTTPAQGEQVVIDQGHLDIGPRWVDGEWTVQVRDDRAASETWRDPEDVVMSVLPAAALEVPDSAAYAFLGEPGERRWLLPQVQDESLLWPGWNTQDDEVVRTVEREVTWALEDVAGPGRFVLFLNQGFDEPDVLFDSDESMPQETGIDVNTHVHGNFAFAAPGVYLLRVSMSADLTDGQQVRDEATLRFAVAEPDPASALDVRAPWSEEQTDAASAAGEQPTAEVSSAAADTDEGTPLAMLVLLGVLVVVIGLGIVLVVRTRGIRRG